VEASALSHPVGLSRVSLAGPLLRLRTDDQLVALFRAGHDEAFGAIHDRYRARLFAYARQMLGGSRSDAEDVLQDVFLRAYHALRADGRQVALRAWLYRVAHNRCIDQLRRPTPAAEDIFDVNRGSTGEQPAEAYERREDLRRLIADVRALPEQQRSALLMREMEGLSYNDLAEALGVTVPAIKSLLVRARIGLVEALEARDTACVEIRDDLVAAFDRGVRVSGRAKKHLRECAGCREYRTALRGVEKRLNGLAPSHGPLTLVAKLLGLGGAGSGGGAFALGGGGAAAGAGATVGTAAVTTGGVATIGGGAVATKVVAVVAAAAVVGGGAATVKKVEHAVKPAPPARTLVHEAAPAAAAPAAVVAHQAARDAAAARADRHRPLSRAGGHQGAASATHAASATRMAATADTASTDSTDPAPALEPTSGGLEAPAEAAETTPTDPGASGTATSGTADATTTGAGSTATTTDQATTGASTTTTTTSTTAATSPAAGAATTGATTQAGASGGAAAPSGASSPSASGPIAQGASAPPAG
jgi:RNA polymerase sigma factor (sigma-70 family)